MTRLGLAGAPIRRRPEHENRPRRRRPLYPHDLIGHRIGTGARSTVPLRGA